MPICKLENSNCYFVDYEPIIQAQEERVRILTYLYGCANGDGDIIKARELRAMLFYESEILEEMKKKVNRN